MRAAPSDVREMVDANDTHRLSEWLSSGGDPDLIVGNESLLYVATGPHGGHEVLRLLLDAGADPNKGMVTYSPLMNAASWCRLEACKLLVEHGADPKARNSKGETALAVVGCCGTQCDVVTAYLQGL